MLVQRMDSPRISSAVARWLLMLAVGVAALGNQAHANFTDVTTSVLPIPLMSDGMPPNLKGGAVTGDFDGDGDIDIFMPTSDGRDLFFRNNGDGSFNEIGEQSGFTAVTDGYAAGAADIDNDGDLDIYVTAAVEPGHYLYINNGSGFFTEEADTRGASIPGGLRFGRGVAFGDYDKDGYLDIFVVEWL